MRLQCFLFTAGGSVVTGTVINLVALMILMLLQPFGRALSDRIGRKPLLVFFGVGSVVYTWFLILYLPQQSDWRVAFLILAVGFVILSGYSSINALVKSGLFPVHVRALGVGLCFS